MTKNVDDATNNQKSLKDKQLLRDENQEPTSQIIAEGLGEANSAYLTFIGELEDHSIEVEWRYYNDGKAWLGKALHKWTTKRGTPKEKTAFWLSIWEGHFRVSIFIPEKARIEALNLPLSDDIKEMIESAKQVGKLKFFPLVFDIRSSEKIKEIYTLIDFRKAIK